MMNGVFNEDFILFSLENVIINVNVGNGIKAVKGNMNYPECVRVIFFKF